MYPIELARDGLLDIPTEHSAAEKLQQLRDRRRRFDDMDPLLRIRRLWTNETATISPAGFS